VVHHILEHGRHDVAGVVIDRRVPPPLAKRVKTHLQRGRGGYVAVIAAHALKRRGARLPVTADVVARLGVPVIEAADPYDSEIAAAVAALKPDMLCLIGGFGIVKEPLLSIAPRGVLSYHHGDMRRYRGQPAAFWEIYNGESSMGVTVQVLAAGIDCGQPIVEREFEIRPDDTCRSLSARLYRDSADMMLDAIDRLEAGQPVSSIESLGPVYTLPNLRQWLTCEVRVASRVSRSLIRQRVSRRTRAAGG
jgi:methionyl-tRNA formyltransferase